MGKVLLAGLLAGALMVPQSSLSADNSDGFRLPPIPYAETIPWLTGGSSAQKARSYMGLLLAPRPLTVEPIDFAAVPIPSRTLLSSQFVNDPTVSTE